MVYKGMKLPSHIGDITVKEYQALSKIYDSDREPLDKGVEYLSVLTSKSVSEIESLDYKVVMDAAKKVGSIMSTKPSTKIKPYIFVNGKFYKACLNAEDLTTAQYIDLKNLASNGVIDNLHLLLGVLYQRVNFLGVPKKYDGAKLKQVSKDMLCAKIDDVYSLVFFYSGVLERLSPIIQMYSDRANQTLQDHIQEMMKDSEFLEHVGAGDI